MGTPESHTTTETKLERIAWLSGRDSEKEFCSLMHLFNVESLKGCFNRLDGNKAVGIDGIDKAKYAEKLDANLEELISRMKRMAYRPGPVRQVLIPKEGKPGATRPLGISNLEDKIVQGMMRRVLESIYEPLFLECSYGFRPGRGPHDAIRALHAYLYRNEVQTVIDVDLKNFFGSIDHNELETILRRKIKDTRFMRYLIRMFKAGVLAEGELTVSEEGVPQGSSASPILANIVAHHVIDEWFEHTVKAHCQGKVELFRYADDCVVVCQHASDAERIRKALGKRLAKHKLGLNEEKTQLVSFSRGSTQRTAFDFLGFTFYLGRSRRGFVIPKLKTAGKRFRAKLKRVNQWARQVRSRYRQNEIWRVFTVKLRGHIQYYGVSHNGRRVENFIDRATKILFVWLNRRSQKKSLNWDQFNLYIRKNPLPKVRVFHRLF